IDYPVVLHPTFRALLKTAQRPDEVTVARGLKYLRTLQPKHTYVVSLQTQVFCKANQKQDAELIKRNVAWLEKNAIRAGKKLEGWSYGAGGGAGGPDNSNTRYAVSGLYAAHQAGFKAETKDQWEQIRDMYVRTQTPGGGWNYREAGGMGTLTMTTSAILSLVQ